MIQYSLTFLLVTIFFLLSPQHANAEDAPWGYVGETGPEHWGELSPALSICSQGREQSPIDIETSMTVKAEPPALVLSWQAFAPAITNSGHSLEISTQGKAGSAAVGNRTYRFVQFHFHHGSEHRINGKQMEAEIHFVLSVVI
ncbi:carbonic anhydrase family protein [Ruegeria halocynthiae]|uniref:carbonic anhydrase family protein n=1 Tax=Ruegeria halocynthiae TaxID=985054 RepID=UPI00126799A9|nr:carbonic anhydrase family protein [Ruegeria halocynthiae]